MESLFFAAPLLLLLFAGNCCADIIDLTDDCNNNAKINFFLTHGMGYADGLSLRIGSYDKNCTINLYTSKTENETSQIIVLESLSGVEWADFCGRNAIKIIDESKTVNMCKQCRPFKEDVLYVGVTESHKTAVQIQGSSPETLKVTATSARKFREDEECSSAELECKVSNYSFCINTDLQCDGNINCGSHGVFDEDSAECHSENHRRYLIIILTTSTLFLITVVIITKICHGYCPKTPKTFFKTDNSEDNKLIVSSRFEKHKTPVQEKKASPVTASGDTLERVEEKEIRSLYYENPPKKKRLTTNSPVYRNTRVTTILLDDMRTVSGFVSDTGIEDTQSRVSQFWKSKSKCKSFI